MINFRIGLFIYFMSLLALMGYYLLEARIYIELQSDEPSGIYVPLVNSEQLTKTAEILSKAVQ